YDIVCIVFSDVRSATSSTLFPYTTLFRSQGLALPVERTGFEQRFRIEQTQLAADMGEAAAHRQGGRGEDPRRLRTLAVLAQRRRDRKSTRLNSSHVKISYAVFCLKKKKTK